MRLLVSVPLSPFVPSSGIISSNGENPIRVARQLRLSGKSLSQSLNLPTLDTLTQELAAIQQTGSRRIALLGSRHVPIMHQQLIEMMSYALVLAGNRLVTSGATGTNSAAIKGA